WTAIAEQSLAATEDHWMQPELILIDEPVRHQRLGQTRAAHDENRSAQLALQPRDFRGGVSDYRGPVPGDPVQRPRRNVFGQPVQGEGDQVAFVRHAWPVSRPDLISPPAE